MKNDRIINEIIDAYISVYGLEKWNSLTAEQQHAFIMISVKAMIIALDN